MNSTEARTQPVGFELLYVLRGHGDVVLRLTWAPDGRTLASTSVDRTIRLWDLGLEDRQARQVLSGHHQGVNEAVWGPELGWLASASFDRTIRVWNLKTGQTIKELHGHTDDVSSIALSPDGETLASASADRTVRLWRTDTWEQSKLLEGHTSNVYRVAWSSDGRLASCSKDGSVIVWSADDFHVASRKFYKSRPGCVAWSHNAALLAASDFDGAIHIEGTGTRVLEGHTGLVRSAVFSFDDRILASSSMDGTVRLWRTDTGEQVAQIEEPASGYWPQGIAFHPTEPILATFGEQDRVIRLWRLDIDGLLGLEAAAQAVHHTTGKVVLLGDHSVGKSALGHRLIHGEFKEQASTHGQQFWIFPALGRRRADGMECEAILWDFAGQPDYRLVHALFVDDADLALVLFDASDIHDPLHGVGFWLKQLQRGQGRCPVILVAAQTDRGSCTLTREELNAFCRGHGIEGPIWTSSFTGDGIRQLVEHMKSAIPWEDKHETVTTTTFKRIKDYVLGLKQAGSGRPVIVTPAELRARLEATDANWRFTDAEMLAAVGHLENYGYARRLRTSQGEVCVLLEPERLNNLASSFVLEARRNPRGLGALEESRLLAGDYGFPELKDLEKRERDVLLDSAALLFLEHHVCFRETDPLRIEPYLVFPELINLKQPLGPEQATEDGVAYTVSGPTENVFASLVVLLGYTHTFTRTNQWQNNARYEVGEGLVCGFRQEAERDGELDFVLCFGSKVGAPVRTLFQGLFESFLARRNLTVMRYEPLRCSKGHQLNRAVVREVIQRGDETTFCSKCGERMTVPKMTERIQVTREVQVEVESQRRAAEQRTRFEQAVFRVRAYAAERKITPPDCFISYAWGVPEHERWVEKRLAPDLQKAGIEVLLDRWHNAQIGASVSRFVERIEECRRVIVVGTPLYRQKAKNVVSEKGSVVAAEYDLAGIRLLASEAQKCTVLPVLLAGDESESFPALVRGRVYADFRAEDAYFAKAFDLILSLYDLPPNDAAVADLRQSLSAPAMA